MQSMGSDEDTMLPMYIMDVMNDSSAKIAKMGKIIKKKDGVKIDNEKNNALI